MKTYIFTLLALFLSAATIQAQENKEHTHNEHLSTLINEYLAAKDALTVDNFGEAQNHISNFTKEVKSNNEMNEHKEHQKKHEAHHSKMLAAVEKASSANNIEELRNSLEGITEELLEAIENQGYDKSVLYVQFCPMANDGKGAKWMSDKEEIRNPYFGKKMHKCGATVKTIN